MFFGAHHVPDFGELALFLEFLVWGLWSRPVSSGFSTLPWSPMCAAAGPPRWSPGAACWREAFGIHWWDATCLRVVCGGVCVLLLTDWGGLFPPGSAMPPPQPLSGPQWEFLGARAIIADLSLSLGPVACYPRLRFCLSCSFSGLCCARSGRQRSHSFSCSRSSRQRLSQFAPVVLVTSLIYWGLLVFLLIRFGLLACVAQDRLQTVSLESFPLTTQGSAWYAGISLAGILLMAAMAFYGFYTSLGGRPVFGGAVLEE